MEMFEKIKQAYILKLDIDRIDSEIQKLKEEKEKAEKELAEVNTLLLTEMLGQKKDEIETDDHIFANYFCKSEFSYGDEKALLKYLQEKGLTPYINTKITTTVTINKNALKKDLKENKELKESLSQFVGDRKVEYVVVTNYENHQKMLEHIEEGKK